MVSEMVEANGDYDTKSGIYFFTPTSASNTFAFYFKEEAWSQADIKQKRIIITEVVT
jgi:uncharacterized membrane protein